MAYMQETFKVTVPFAIHRFTSAAVAAGSSDPLRWYSSGEALEAIDCDAGKGRKPRSKDHVIRCIVNVTDAMRSSRDNSSGLQSVTHVIQGLVTTCPCCSIHTNGRWKVHMASSC